MVCVSTSFGVQSGTEIANQCTLSFVLCIVYVTVLLLPNFHLMYVMP